jgi:hypothetical protein
MTEPFYHTVTIHLHIAYDGTLHFYNRRENGRIVIDAKPISAQRAADIMKLNDDDPAVQTSQRPIGSGWSWMASVNVQVEEETV